LKPLAELSHLTILDLSENPITKSANYRDEVFKTLPKLEVLDMQYKSGEAYESEDGKSYY
jgi:Leucine-rich repeat (LRR) protein